MIVNRGRRNRTVGPHGAGVSPPSLVACSLPERVVQHSRRNIERPRYIARFRDLIRQHQVLRGHRSPKARSSSPGKADGRGRYETIFRIKHRGGSRSYAPPRSDWFSRLSRVFIRVIDFPRRRAVDIRLLHDGEHGVLGPATPLDQRRPIRPGNKPGPRTLLHEAVCEPATAFRAAGLQFVITPVTRCTSALTGNRGRHRGLERARRGTMETKGPIRARSESYAGESARSRELWVLLDDV